MIQLNFMILKIIILPAQNPKPLILWALLLSLAGLFAQVEPLTEFAKIHLDQKFARLLYSEGEFQRSANEFQRLHVLHQNIDPQGTVLDSLLIQGARAWRSGSFYKKSNTMLEKMDQAQSSLWEQSILMKAANHFNLSEFEASKTCLTELWDGTDEETLRKAELLTCCNLLVRGEIPAAKNVAASIQSEKLLELVSLAEGFKYKSPALAAVMSTLIPGSGKLYTERYWDALTSFLTVGFSARHAWAGFKRNGTGSVIAWIHTIVGTYFYLGNIYGSAASAKLYNENQTENIRRTLDQLVRETF